LKPAQRKIVEPARLKAVEESIARRVEPLEIRSAPALPAVSRGRGRRLPSTLAALDRRDDLLRQAFRRFFPVGTTYSEGADVLHQRLSIYLSSGWRNERSSEHCPQRFAGRLAEYVWLILQAHPVVPASRTIRGILAIRGQRADASSDHHPNSSEAINATRKRCIKA
jgi:hypothetical protein